jgi:DNA segregation ATPase FtsK/SpoIIIE-like protein
MRIFWQALRAATIETLGVALVVILVFGLPTWSLQQATQTNTSSDAVWDWFKALPHDLQRHFAADRPDNQRQQYVEQRLSHYGQLYGDAARQHVRDWTILGASDGSHAM